MDYPTIFKSLPALTKHIDNLALLRYAENVARTTVSVNTEILLAGKRRQKALRYKSFSGYVEYLIEKDAKERPEHVTVREETDSKYHRGKKHASVA